jgi:hypothetical protein
MFVGLHRHIGNRRMQPLAIALSGAGKGLCREGVMMEVS